MHYNSGIGGIQNSIDMQRLIQNIEWEPKKMDILEHIEKIDSMITLCSDLGHTIDEKSRCAYIIASLQRAHAPQYVKDLEEAERGQHTLPCWLISRLSRTASNLAMKGARKGKRGMCDLSDPRESDAEFAGEVQHATKRAFKDMTEEFAAVGVSVQPRKGKKPAAVFLTNEDYGETCNSCPQGAHGTVCVASAPLRRKVKASAHVVTYPKCQKNGHTMEDCWRDEVCDTCGIKGHISKVCSRFIKAGASAAKNVSFEKFPKVRK
jgi:hypothetical protein